MPLDLGEKPQKYLSQLNMNNYKWQLIYNPPTPNIYPTPIYASASAQESIASTHISVQLPEDLCTLAASLNGSSFLHRHG